MLEVEEDVERNEISAEIEVEFELDVAVDPRRLFLGEEFGVPSLTT